MNVLKSTHKRRHFQLKLIFFGLQILFPYTEIAAAAAK